MTEQTEKEKVAIILAAGRGSRLKELSLEQPKPMVTVHSETIISNLVKLIIQAGIQHIVVMIGYQAEKLRNHLSAFSESAKLTFVENEIYDKTNNIYTLWLAKDYLKNGFYLFEADVFLEQAIMNDFVTDPHADVMLVDQFNSLMNGTVVNFDESRKVKGMFLNSDQVDGFSYSDKYKTVNFYKISSELANAFFIPRLNFYIEQKITGSYYELIIKEAIDQGIAIYALETGDRKWFEIDTQEDLRIAEKIFA